MDVEFYEVRWFGQSWGSPLNQMNPEVATPIGRPCHHCGKAFVDGDTGMITGKPGADAAWHLACFNQVVEGAKAKA